MSIERMTLDEIFDVETEHSPLVGGRTSVFLEPQERADSTSHGLENVRLTKRDLALRISSETGLNQKEVLSVVQKSLDYIADALSSARKVELPDFGVFEIRGRELELGKDLPRIPALAPNDLLSVAKQAEFRPAKMATLCSMSERHLQRIFKKHLQRTPGQWLRELQVRLAKQLLAQGYSTKAAAAELNFATDAHLCREFKKVFGTFPSRPAQNQGISLKLSHTSNPKLPRSNKSLQTQKTL